MTKFRIELNELTIALCFIASLIFVGCSPGTESDYECGSGEGSIHDGKTYCIFESSITEEGFSCPASHQYAHEFGGQTLCSGEETLSDETRKHFRDFLSLGGKDAGPDDANNLVDVGVDSGDDMEDLCLNHSCVNPEATCDGSVATFYVGAAYCEPETGECDYGRDMIDCAETNQVCEDGFCRNRRECECRPGIYKVSGQGDGFMVEYDLEVTEVCGADPVCTVNGTVRKCFQQLENFRIYLDELGYVQLIFFDKACDEPWTGRYATQGGNAQIEAVRVP